MSENHIVINADLGETRVALVEGGMIAEFLLERRDDRSIVGNVYKGKVARVLPGMQAAFVDVGLDRSAFLHVSQLHNMDAIELFSNREGGDAAESYENGQAQRTSRHSPIESLIKEGESIIVQISKGPISTKGARVTAHVSLPGRHLVYMPTSNRGGISRRIPNDEERQRLKKILKRIAPKKGALIGRTVAAEASADALEADVSYLTETWTEIVEAYGKRKKPGLLYEELDLPLRIARDRLNESVSELVVDNKDYHKKLIDFIDRLMPARLDTIKLYDGDEPIFDAFGIEQEIKRALERRVELPSGGSLIIDQAEALTAIDVNTGKFVGKGMRDHEETILVTNLEAVDEIAYQLRFRNIGGLIVLDLIDMERHANRRKVLDRLKHVLKDDRAKASVIKISQFGLIEMTRQRTSDSLGRMLHESCPYCDGTGQILSRVTVANEALRELQRHHHEFKGDIELKLHPNVAEVLKGKGAGPLKKLKGRIRKKVVLSTDSNYHQELFQLKDGRQKGAGKEKP